ncbi:MAG: polyphosphate kinase 2 family protein [Planctomycetales bacterium]|nr:polyphosphate kinase 2 family protein [Planctomycetales bacterium]
MPFTHRLSPSNKIRLAEVPTSGHDFHQSRDKAEEEFKALRKRLAHLQNRLYASGKHRLLVLLQAMDAGGKDSTIRHVFKGVNPQGVQVHSFKTPSKEELSHDYLWRVHAAAPAAGTIGVFNRSHYEDVLVVRVEDLVPRSIWEKRYQHINDFERMLSDCGTTILKFFLHISKDEQKKRFQDRLSTFYKQWKFSVDDLRKRKQWDQYQEAFEDMLNNCTTDHAPWYVIPADQKWYRNLTISKTIVHALEDLDPEFPSVEEGIENVVIE